LDDAFRADEQAAGTRCRFNRRKNSQVRAIEQVQSTADHSERRLDPVFRAGEQAADT